MGNGTSETARCRKMGDAFTIWLQSRCASGTGGASHEMVAFDRREFLYSVFMAERRASGP